MAKLLGYLLSALCLIHVLPVNAKPCFITNCPPGGKRSGSAASMPSAAGVIAPRRQQCTTCGPNDAGLCLGQSLCCGPSFGCFFNTKESAACLMSSAQLCNEVSWDGVAGFAVCSLQPGASDGLCIADRLCCSPSQCKPDKSCRITRETQLQELLFPLEFGARLSR